MQLHALRPQAKLIAYLKTAFWGGIIGTAVLNVPLLLSFLWPACRPHEKKMLGWGGAAALLLFLGGCFLSWRFLSPTVFSWLADFASEDGVKQLWSLEAYLDLLLLLIMLIGIVFQIPWIMLLLLKTGLLKRSWLKRYRRHIFLVAFIAGALFTPPDIYSQILLGALIVLLFETTLLLARLFHLGK